MAEVKRVTRIGVYVNSKCIVEQETAKYGHNSGDEQGDGWDGALYFTDGNDKTTVDFTTITPRTGHEAVELKEAMINKTTVELSLTVDGGIEKVKGRLFSREYDSDSKSGMVKCSWKFQGGPPTVI